MRLRRPPSLLPFCLAFPGLSSFPHFERDPRGPSFTSPVFSKPAMGSGQPKSGRRLARQRRAKGGKVNNSNAFVLVSYLKSLLRNSVAAPQPPGSGAAALLVKEPLGHNARLVCIKRWYTAQNVLTTLLKGKQDASIVVPSWRSMGTMPPVYQQTGRNRHRNWISGPSSWPELKPVWFSPRERADEESR
jgi:hypothetical protein